MRPALWISLLATSGIAAGAIMLACERADTTCAGLRETCPGDGVVDGCDTKKSLKDSPCLIAEKFGVFVAATGDNATGDGSMAKPFQTIQPGFRSIGDARA